MKTAHLSKAVKASIQLSEVISKMSRLYSQKHRTCVHSLKIASPIAAIRRRIREWDAVRSPLVTDHRNGSVAAHLRLLKHDLQVGCYRAPIPHQHNPTHSVPRIYGYKSTLIN